MYCTKRARIWASSEVRHSHSNRYKTSSSAAARSGARLILCAMGRSNRLAANTAMVPRAARPICPNAVIVPIAAVQAISPRSQRMTCWAGFNLFAVLAVLSATRLSLSEEQSRNAKLESRHVAHTSLQETRCVAAPPCKTCRASVFVLLTRLRVRKFSNDVLAGRGKRSALRLREPCKNFEFERDSCGPRHRQQVDRPHQSKKRATECLWVGFVLEDDIPG
jgi:hypothetical protein